MTKTAVADYRFYNESPETADFCREVVDDFSTLPRSIPPKYFYDEQGSRTYKDLIAYRDFQA